MISSSTLLRSFIIYAICLPLAVFLGYMVASPLTWTSFGTVLAVLFALALPLLLRFHHFLLVLAWNAFMVVFFLPGGLQMWVPLAIFSLTISVIRRTIDSRYRFISVPEVTKPLLALAAVVLITAAATGGIQIRSLGGEVYGGKKYVYLLGAIVGYFALTANRIPPKRAGLYTKLFFLGGLTALIGEVFYFENSSLQYLYMFFPPSRAPQAGALRLVGFGAASFVIFSYMLSRYGIRGLCQMRKPWRLVIFSVFMVLGLYGGFRSTLISFMLVLTIQFFLEGLHRTALLPFVVLSLALCVCVTLPFVRQMPFPFQRAISFLPVEVDPAAQQDARASLEWRLNMWLAVLPQVPEHLLLGKGLSMTPKDFDFALGDVTHSMKPVSEDQNWAALSGDYHSGPLSLIIPFGIWGVMAFTWFMVAAFRVLISNYRYGDPGLRTINTFLLAVFTTRALIFVTIVGGFYGDMQMFVGYLAFSIALNGGKACPAPAPEPVPTPAFSSMLPRRSVLGRMG